MKPDKKKELPTEEYQRPPLLEEIKTFFGNIWNWIQNLVTSFVQFLEIHSADISMGILLVILVAFSTYLLKQSTVSRHYIYNRYRIGHYSKMMWNFIGGGLVQLFAISLVVGSIWLGSFTTAVIVYIVSVVSMLIFINRTYQELLINKPKLEKPLTRTQNDARQRRYDLIPNVVNSVKGYMTHEEEVFKSIADARAKIGSNASAKEKTAAQGELDSAISRLLVLTENYPTLRSNEQVQSLIVELEGTENRIYVARTDYNAAVTKYNKSIRSFPKNIIANSFGFKEKELVNATKDAQTKVPTVDLSNK